MYSVLRLQIAVLRYGILILRLVDIRIRFVIVGDVIM